MERQWPAVDAAGADWELLLALIDDCSPAAVEERGDTTRFFFATLAARDAAVAVLLEHGVSATPVEVADENWAERSQADLAPVTVGRFTILPTQESSDADPFRIAIPPSIAFGTGHHATTRLCLEAMQRLDLGGQRVLDLGTGSGVLAIAATRLGAASVVGIDVDADAIRAARDNLALNGGDPRVRFELGDLRSVGRDAGLSAGGFGCVVANLTGELLIRSAPFISAWLSPGGWLILSGLLATERDAVVRAFGGRTPIWHDEEGDWAVVVLGR